MIKFEKRFKIEKVASTDVTRPSLNQLIVGEDWVAATNGHALVKVPASRVRPETYPEIDEERTHDSIDLAALKAARKEQKGYLIDVATRQGQFAPPPIAQVIPTIGRDTCFEVALSVDELANIAAALDTETVVLRFGGWLEPIEILPTRNWSETPNRSELGVLMPFRHEKDEPECNKARLPSNKARLPSKKDLRYNKDLRDQICELAEWILEENL